MQSWEAAIVANRYDELLLAESFLPAVRTHLLSAYGWYLLAVSGVEESSLLSPPATTSALAPPEAGKALAPELREFSAMEQRGWLADLLSRPEEHFVAARDSSRIDPRNHNTLVTDRSVPGHAVVNGWQLELQSLMNRMDDSLQES